MWNDPINDELMHHFEQLKQERLDAGDSDDEAARFARLRLGHDSAIRDKVHDVSPWHQAGMIARHIRFALRSYRRNGGAYILATGILALGIGLSVAMFSLVEAVVLNPLPFPNQDRVHLIWKTDPQINQQLVGELALPELDDLRAHIPEIESVALFPAALYGNGRVLQVGTGEPVQIETCPSTAQFFKVLGVKPVLGRDFEVDDEAPGAAPVVILSDLVWREHFSGRRDVVGQMIRLNGLGHAVIGVMPPGVEFPRGAALWIPLKTDPLRGMTWLLAIARTKPGVPLTTLQSAADRTFQLQTLDYPKEYSATQRAVVMPVTEYWTGSSKPQLLVSLSASLLLLLSACASAGNLFLSRALVRRREVATRISLGASPAQILIYFGVEGLLAASLATLAGGALAAATIRLLIRWAPADIPRIEAAGIDLKALAVASAAALLAALACAIGPALMLRRRNLDALLRDGGARTAGSRTGQRLQSAFVFSQAALTVAILSVGLLLFVSYRAMIRTDTGFANRDALTMNLALRGQEVTQESRRRFYTDLLDRLRTTPTVTSAAAVLLRPFEGPIGWDTSYKFEFEASRNGPNQLPKANFEVVTPQYFETVGTALLSGRDFNPHDTKDSEMVAIISQSLARRMPGDAVGQRIFNFGAWRKIVGVTADARYRRVVQSGDNIYVPYLQASPPTNYLVIRGQVPVPELLALVRRTLKEIDPSQAIAGEATLGELLDRNTARDRFNLSIMILFAIGAILLAAAGIHSVVRESVIVRAKEIAIRVALGAGRGRLVAQITGGTLRWIAAGQLIGLLAAVLMGRAVSDLLYAVSPRDPLVLMCVLALVSGVAVFASFIPAWIAAGRDPRQSLLEE